MQEGLIIEGVLYFKCNVCDHYVSESEQFGKYRWCLPCIEMDRALSNEDEVESLEF